MPWIYTSDENTSQTRQSIGMKSKFWKKKQTNSLMVFAVVLLFSKIILPRYNHCISVTGKDNTNLKILFADSEDAGLNVI